MKTPAIYTLSSAVEAQAFAKGVVVGSKGQDKTIVILTQNKKEVEVIVYAKIT